MLKRDEIADPNSCLNKAKDDEMLFVLLVSCTNPELFQRLLDRERVEHGHNKETWRLHHASRATRRKA